MVGAVGEVLRHQFSASFDLLRLLATIQPGDVGQELDLRRRPLAVRPVELGEHMPRIQEQHRIGASTARLALVEEPQRAGQRHGVEEVRANRDHHIDCARLDQLLADFKLRTTGIAGAVGHHEASAPRFVQRGIEQLNPQVVSVIDRGHAKREARCVVLDPLLVDLIDIERRIGHHEIELTADVVHILGNTYCPA